MNLKDFLNGFAQESQNQKDIIPSGQPRDFSSTHEPAPDIWLEILPFLDQRSETLDQQAEISPELLQD
jgi:hypothetical protein